MLDPSDTSVPRAARVHDALLGGKDNYEADRAVADQLTRFAPDLPAMVRAQRAALRRIVTFLVREAGLRQLLDIGTGIPSRPNVHEIAQAAALDTRVVYVDSDPSVLAHARARLRSRRGGATGVVEADVRATDTLVDPGTVGGILDLGQPVGVLLVGVLHQLRDEDDPWAAVRRLMGALPAGSHLAVAHLASDIAPDLVAGLTGIAAEHGLAATARSREEVAGFVAGLEVVPPGIVPLLEWRPESRPRRSPQPDVVPVWVAVGHT